MAIFKKKKEEVSMTSAPEENETPGEIKHIEELASDTTANEPKVQDKSEINYREIPVCLSPTQINNLIIENNMMLKQILSNTD